MATRRGVWCSAPDPDERGLLENRKRRHAHTGGHIWLRRDPHASPVEVINASVIGAHQLVTEHGAARERKTPVSATVFERGDRSAGATPKNNVSVEHSPPDRCVGQFVGSGGRISALLRIVGVHRSNTIFSVSALDTHVIMTVPDACSDSLRTDSWPPFVPSFT